MRQSVGALALGLLLLAAIPAAAQDVEIETRPGGEPRPNILVPGPDPVPDRPVDYDIYPNGFGPFVRQEPAFFEDLSTRTATGRFGFSGWTAPNTPVGPGDSGYRDDVGWFSLGFTFTWDGPPASAPRRPAPR